MLRYWSSLRYSLRRTLFLLADDLLHRRPFHKSIYRHLGNTLPSLYCLIHGVTERDRVAPPGIVYAIHHTMLVMAISCKLTLLAPGTSPTWWSTT